MSVADSSVPFERPGGWRWLKYPASRFMLGLAGILLHLGLLLLGLRLVFLAGNWASLRAAGLGEIGHAMLSGLRFDAAALAFLIGPILFIYYAAGVVRWRVLRWVILGYLVLVSLLLPAFVVTDLQYFEESGKHLTYELTAHLGQSGTPMLLGAFRLHPVLCWVGIVVCVGFGAGSWWELRWLLRKALLRDGRRPFGVLVTLPVCLTLGYLAGRGLGREAMTIGDALISPNPYVNALCLNPAYSVIQTVSSRERRECHFFDEPHNIRVTRELLGCADQPPLDEKYPLLRFSAGTPQGNRKNVVLFLLESWSGKDIGCLGGNAAVTPYFDSLARQGLLFTRFFATGVRTPEGALSTLCSFPNQPLAPIANQPEAYQAHWRSLSQILEEVGYHNVFVHGRDLDFDKMDKFCTSIHFHKLIDRDDFPSSISTIDDTWPGYSDEEVMRRADEEFAAEQDHPFFGVIYTMNTHPPFVTPEGYPRLFPGGDRTTRFLNALHYSDHTLEMFFELAKKRPYFQDTIFIFIADHARTKDSFTYANQHHIPLLVYAPGYVKPEVRRVVAGQLDVLPTVLGLLELKTLHAAWGRDLRTVSDDSGFAVSVAGDEVRWRDSRYVLVDGLTDAPPLLFDTVRDPECKDNITSSRPETTSALQGKLRAYMSLSQTVLDQNRVFPTRPRSAALTSP